jgi:hypothetical protein
MGIPLPREGDFVNEWDTPEQAVADILDYFFGDPTRMLVKQRALEEEMRRLARDPECVSDFIKLLHKAAVEGNMQLAQYVVTELRRLVEFGADAVEFRQAARSAADAASARGRRQVAEYLGSVA